MVSSKPSLHKHDEAPGAAATTWISEAATRIGNNKVKSLLVYVGLVFVKVLAVSRWRQSTALGVLNTSSLPSIFAGATLSAVPSVALIVSAAMLYPTAAGYWRARWRAPGQPFLRRNRTLLATFVLAAALVVVTSPWVLASIAVGAALVVGWLVRLAWALHCRTRGRASMHRRSPQFVLGAAAMTVVLAFLSYTQLVSAVWIPHQVLRDASGRVLDVGYVLDDTAGNITMLESHSRLLAIYDDAQVRSREVCTDTIALGGLLSSSRDSLWLVIVGGPKLPTCPHRPHR